MSGLVTGSWEGVRVKALATHPTFDLIYAADTHCRIRQYNFADKTSSTLWVQSTAVIDVHVYLRPRFCFMCLYDVCIVQKEHNYCIYVLPLHEVYL